MSIDLSTLSPRELGALIASARKRQQQLAKRSPASKVRAKLTRLAKAEGYTIEELFGPGGGATGTRGAARPARKLGKVPPKYRNPDNPEQTWTGRGKAPLWFAALIDSGKTREDLLIPPTSD